MPRRASDELLVGLLEQVSWKVLADYREIVQRMIRGRSGIYALYRHDKLYYVGLAKNLMGRVNGHLRDRHRGEWDRFSVYLTSSNSHIKPLESLLLRIAKPTGNRVSGRFQKSSDLYRFLSREMSHADASRRARILGGTVARRLRRRRARSGKGSLSLAGLVERRLPLRATSNGQTVKATLLRDGHISFDGRKYESPSAAAKRVVGHAKNGWRFWFYRKGPRTWVPLGHLRK